MASQSARPELTTSDSEKQSTSQARPVLNEIEKIESAETLPGWTIMRPLRMRGLKGKGKVGTTTSGSRSRNVDSKGNDDLKVTPTNDTGDGPGGIGEVEALHEVRSDDELLGPEDDEPTRQRVTAERGIESIGGDQVNGTSSERVYKVYKRRWFGLVQLVLLNIIVSWDVSTPLCIA
jgi:FLVCR family MFS transporter 7